MKRWRTRQRWSKTPPITWQCSRVVLLSLRARQTVRLHKVDIPRRTILLLWTCLRTCWIDSFRIMGSCVRVDWQFFCVWERKQQSRHTKCYTKCWGYTECWDWCRVECGLHDKTQTFVELDRKAGQTMEGGFGMIRVGAVLVIVNCRLPGFQIHDRNFEPESSKAWQERHRQENVRNDISYGEWICVDDAGRMGDNYNWQLDFERGVNIPWYQVSLDRCGLGTVFHVYWLRTATRQHRRWGARAENANNIQQVGGGWCDTQLNRLRSSNVLNGQDHEERSGSWLTGVCRPPTWENRWCFLQT